MAAPLHRPLSELLTTLLHDRSESLSAPASNPKENVANLAFASRCELVATSLSLGVPLQEIEDYLDFIDELPRR